MTLLLVVAWPELVFAQDPEISVSLTETGVMDSNPMMRTDDIKELWGVTTAPRLTIEDKTETSKISLSTWIENNIFNRSEFDTTDAHTAFAYSKQRQRLDYGIRVSGDYDTTRTSEVTTLGTETGLIRHLAYTVAPSIGLVVSPISRIDLTGNYYKSAYDKGAYVDYHTLSVSPSYIRNFSELYAGVFSINARRYESEEGPKKIVDSIGPSFGVKAKLTQKLTADARAGREASRETVQGIVTQEWAWNTVFSGDLTFKGDQDSLKVSATRAQQSYGNGNDSILTTLSFSENYKINPSLSANVGGSYQFSDSGQASGTTLDVLYSGNAGMTYHATEVLDLSTLYRYRNKSFTDRADKAEENIIRVGVSYRPQLDGLF